MLALLTSRQCRSCSVDDIVAGVVVFLIMASKKSSDKKVPSPSDTAEKAMMKYFNAPNNRAAMLPLKTTVSAKYPAGLVEQQGRGKVASDIHGKAYKAAVAAKGVKALKKKK